MQETLKHQITTEVPNIPAKPSLFNRRSLWVSLLLGALVWSLLQAGLFSGDLVNEGGWTVLRRFFEALLHPDLSPEFLRLTAQATLTTLAFAICGVTLSLVFGFFGGILASQVWWKAITNGRARLGILNKRAPWLAIRSVLAFLRAIHEIIWGLLFINLIGLDPLSAILAIAIPYGAIIAKIFSEILDESPHQAFTAVLNSGVSPPKAFAYTLLPQATADLISYSFYRFECAIRSAAVLGIIGAGGLGYQIFLSLQTLKYEQIWTLLLALFLLNGAVDLWSSMIRRRINSSVYCGSPVLDLDVIKGKAQNLSKPQGIALVRASIVVIAVLIPFSFWYVNPTFSKLLASSTWEQFKLIANEALPLRFDIFTFQEWLKLSSITLSMSVLAVSGAGLFSLFLSFPAASNFLLRGGLLDRGRGSKTRHLISTAVLVFARGLLLILRSVPAPIWALLLLFVLFPGILPGAVALGLYTLGVLGRLMAEVVENLNERPLVALRSSGATGGQVFSYGVLPLTKGRYLGLLFYRWEEAVRATIVVGLVGAGGLGRQLTEQLSSFNYQSVFTILIVFVAIIFAVDMISANARRAIQEA